MVELRKIAEKDNQAVGEIVQESLKSRGLNLPGTAYFDPHLFSLYAYYQEPKRAYWVLEEEGKIVGGCGIGSFGESETVGELQKLYIRDEAQGKGYAHVLMKQALAFAEEHYEAVYIDTFASLKEANRLYEKYGFVKLSEPIGGSEHNACDTWFLKEF
ncbi:putative acetyltransferase [Alkalibacterium putridalgicola]|uniref:N-acetyltransferase n=1 Tax=Alkalibacterium putridalgicola TaxID=426703 RepID=A0A1H7XNF4_9LACT|nr:GNAT family N-acetyltransferase [Alkalibacterium putridalgicola]GEK90327.1 N-acetyltransferase [Alkalibacterium putridalgicola]SEM35271.1 putative acetyltransferase [Alkalibacterium putridalgicola]